jgi:predicted ATPase/DNA-binding winged helix-turn-helix (wHTH) protein
MDRSAVTLYQFGPFELDPQKRLLRRSGVPIQLTPKAFELLTALIENRDRVVRKDELMEKVWPDSFVEEGNLTQTISVLRKALDDKLTRIIITFPSLGYQFVAEVVEIRPEAHAPQAQSGDDRLTRARRGPEASEDRVAKAAQRQPGPVRRGDLQVLDDPDRMVALRLSSNLPIQPTQLIGREAEIEEAKALLMRPDVRLLNITGPGGIGKTSFAVEVVRELAQAFAGGAFLVSLAAVTDSALVAPTIAQALELRERAKTAPVEGLKEYLGNKQVLLLVDNFEQVNPAALLLADLSASCAGLKIVVTSRILLRVRAERVFRLSPLGLPDPTNLPDLEALLRHPATSLFIQRATAVNPEFAVSRDEAALVTRICIRLDGLPLAIELAAARADGLTPGEILFRLENRLDLSALAFQDLPVRHQTLESAIEWSYDLLSVEDRDMFRRLALFVGGFTCEAARQICAPDMASTTLQDHLSSLLEKSMLKAEGPREGRRFTMLQTIREYAFDRLEQSGEAASLRRRHAAFFCQFAERTESQLLGMQGSAGLDAVEAEIGNLRAAMGWSIENQALEVGMKIVASLRRFWISRGYIEEADDWSKRILSSYEPGWTSEDGKFLGAAGNIANHIGDCERAIGLIEQGIARYKRLGEERQAAELLRYLGETHVNIPDYDLAASIFSEVLDLMRRHGDKREAATALNDLGVIEYERGNPQKGAVFFEECLSLYREIGDDRLAFCLNNLGLSLIGSGDLQKAGLNLRESLSLLRRKGQKAAIIVVLESLAQLASARGDFCRAFRLLGSADAAREVMKLPVPFREKANRDAILTGSLASVDLEMRRAAIELGRAMTLDEAVEYALEDYVMSAPDGASALQD